MKKKSLKLLLLTSCMLHSHAALAANITSPSGSLFDFTTNGETLNITGNGDISTGASSGVRSSGITDVSVYINTTNPADGIRAAGGVAALDVQSGGTLSSLQIDSGTMSNSNAPAAVIEEFSATSSIVNNGTISSGSTSVLVFYASHSGNTAMTFTNGVSGSILTANDGNSTAVYLGDGNGGSSVAFTNDGRINSDGSLSRALEFSGYSATVINNGIINGRINLGAVSTSSITLNAGSTTTSNINLGHASQTVTYNGGTYAGDINGTSNGLGNVQVNGDMVMNGHFGNNNRLNTITVADGKTLNSDTNDNSIDAVTINLGAGSILTIGAGTTSAVVSGTGANQGIVNVTDSNGDISSATFGGTNGIAALNISGGGNHTLSNSVKALVTTISGNNTLANLNANLSITGDVVLEDTTRLLLNDNSIVNGTIRAAVSGQGGILVGFLGNLASEVMTTNGNIGDGGKALSSVTVHATNTFDLSANNNSLAATNGTYLYHDSLLKVGTGIVTSDIKGVAYFNANGNGNGAVQFTQNYALAGDVGTSSGNSLNTVTIDSNKSVSAGAHEINATNIILSAGSELSSGGNISAGGDVNTGLNRTETNILLDTGATLNLNNGADLVGNINGAGNNRGTVTFSGTQTMDGDIGTTQPVAGISVLTNANTTVNGDVSADSYALQGKFHVNGNITGDMDVGSGGQLGGNNTLNGDLSVNNGGAVAPGNSIGTINVVGNVTFNNGSTYQVELAGTQSDRLNATGTITIDPGATLELVPLSTVSGTSFTFLHSDTSLTGTFDTIITNGLGAAISYTATDGLVAISVLTASPDAANAQVSSAFNSAALFSNAVLGNAAEHAFNNETGYWLDTLYRGIDRNTEGSITGYQNNMYGITAGVQCTVSDKYKVGFSLAQLQDDVKLDGGIGKNDGDGTFMSAYGTATSGDVFATLGLTGGYQRYDNARLVSNGGVLSYANSDNDVYEAGALAQVGIRNMIGDWVLTPSAGIEYIHIFAQGYGEVSGGASAVTFDNYNVDTIRPSLNFAVSHAKGITLWNTLFKPNANLGVFYENTLGDNSVSGAFSTGTRFTVDLDHSNRTYGTFGAGFDADIRPGVVGFAHYQGSASDDEVRNDARIGVKLRF